MKDKYIAVLLFGALILGALGMMACAAQTFVEGRRWRVELCIFR